VSRRRLLLLRLLRLRIQYARGFGLRDADELRSHTHAFDIACLEPAVNVNVLDRALLLINDLPGASVQGGLAPGNNEGDTRVVLQSAEKPLITGALNIDSYGALTTGPERMLFDAALNSPSGRGEQYTMGLLATHGVRYGRFGFSVPVGLDGARMGVNSSYMDYTVIAGSSVASNIHGTSTSVGLDTSYPMIRSQQANLFLLSLVGYFGWS
jgi:hemolysin activation/secretion protein